MVSAGAFQRATVATLRSLLADPASADDAQRRTLMQQSLMRALMDIIDSNPANGKAPRPSTRTYIVNRAIEFIEAKIADQITVLHVCSAVRVRERTLCYSFATVLGVTLTQYLRATRLNRVRHELLSGSQRTIESIATQWGFRHMGRSLSIVTRPLACFPEHGTVDYRSQEYSVPQHCPGSYC